MHFGRSGHMHAMGWGFKHRAAAGVAALMSAVAAAGASVMGDTPAMTASCEEATSANEEVLGTFV